LKHWHETKAILERVSRVDPSLAPPVVATVVHIAGSAYRRPGAKLLVEPSGETCGGVSGGCLEADVRGHALEMQRESPGKLIHYDTGSDEETLWGMGLGCEGAVDVFLQPAGQRFLRLREHLAKGEPFVHLTVLEGPLAGRDAFFSHGAFDGGLGDADLERKVARIAAAVLEDGDSQILELAPHRVFADVLRPPPRLAIFGAGDDARPLASLALVAGFEVTVVDHRPAYLTAERFPPPVQLVLRRPEAGVTGLNLGRSHFAVVQTHALKHDHAWAQALSQKPLAYLGLLGPKTRREMVLRDVAVDPANLFAPVGLDLGADGPEQVAFSIVAEMLAVHARREPGHLRSRKRGIHEG
jgi:xanthine dehydrogenase accessory factor